MDNFGTHSLVIDTSNDESLLVKLKDCAHKDKRSGVYRLECNDCQGTCIEGTGHPLKIRVAEHVKSWKTSYL